MDGSPARRTRVEPRRLRGRTAVEPADDHHPAVREPDGGQTARMRIRGEAGSPEETGGRIPELDLTRPDLVGVAGDHTADDQHAAVVQSGGRVAKASEPERWTGRERLGRRIPELGRRQMLAAGRRSARDQDPAVEQEGCGVLEARCRQVADRPEPRLELGTVRWHERRSDRPGCRPGDEARPRCRSRDPEMRGRVRRSFGCTHQRGAERERPAHADDGHRRRQKQDRPSCGPPRPSRLHRDVGDGHPEGQRSRRCAVDLGPVEAAQSHLEVVVVHRTDPLSSAASIAA